MAGRKKLKTVTQKGATITIDCEGFEFRAEDIGWANIHRAALKRDGTKITLTFPTVKAALTAFDEMVTLGAGNVDSVPELFFTNDEMRQMAGALGKK